MSRRRRQKNRTQSQPIQEPKVNVEIDYEKLAQAIVRAKEIEEANEEKRKKEELLEWRKSIGYKEYKNKSGLSKELLSLWNSVVMFFNLIFFSKKKKVCISITGAFMQSLTSMIFNFVKIVFWALCAAFVIVMVYHPDQRFTLGTYLWGIGLTVISFLLASVFRIMAIEIDQMSDRERVLGIFTAVMTVVPMLESILSWG